MHQKPPLIDGKKIDEQYDLDNETHLLQLGLNPKAELKIADKYAHYTHCKYAVIELKSSSTVYKGIKQIESTIKRLLNRGKKIDSSDSLNITLFYSLKILNIDVGYQGDHTIPFSEN